MYQKKSENKIGLIDKYKEKFKKQDMTLQE